MFNYQSSTIDWCESNYVYSNYIAEFWNTISNILYIIVYFLSFRSFKYINCNQNDRLLNTLLLSTGISSFYFHATLSLLGQILDEYSIVLLLTNTLLIIYQEEYIRKLLKLYLFIHTILIFYIPHINIPILFILGFWIKLKMTKIFNKSQEKSHKRYWKTAQYLFILSVLCWISDFLFCGMTFIQFHALWHILSAMCAYYSILVGMFIEYHNNQYYIQSKRLLPIILKK
jgi:alkaline ceramidase